MDNFAVKSEQFFGFSIPLNFIPMNRQTSAINRMQFDNLSTFLITSFSLVISSGISLKVLDSSGSVEVWNVQNSHICRRRTTQINSVEAISFAFSLNQFGFNQCY